jgi:uncharacterized protein involved in copper resistance
MPLRESSSKRAFKHNVEEMVHSGHPIKQAVAAAYSEQRKAKSQHMAEGGEAMELEEHEDHLLDDVAMECMEAIENKDKEAFRDALHVLISDVIHKMSMEMDQMEGEI